MKKFAVLFILVFFIVLTSKVFAAGPQPTQPPQPVTTLSVLFPGGGDLNVGSMYSITWRFTGSVYYQIDILVVGYDKKGNQLGDWQLIAAGVPTASVYYTFTVPERHFILPNWYSGNGEKYRIQIREANDSPKVITAYSKYFSIPVPSVKVISPNGGETWQIGEDAKPFEITWGKTGNIGWVSIYLMFEDGATGFITNAYGGQTTTTTVWLGPGMVFKNINRELVKGKYKIFITNSPIDMNYKGPNVSDESNKFFTIRSTVDSPTKGIMTAESSVLILGEKAVITMDVTDLDGLYGAYINWSDGVQYNSDISWKYFFNNPTNKKVTFRFRLKQPGTYSFFGGVQGRRPDGVAMYEVATPNPLVIRVLTIDQWFMENFPPLPPPLPW